MVLKKSERSHGQNVKSSKSFLLLGFELSGEFAKGKYPDWNNFKVRSYIP